ncbi:MAG: ATP-dependent metallopeptidase FtsH/Yme1/Tma family protein, partial [Aeromicrobium sp.]
MNFKRLAKGPWLWIAVIAIVVLTAINFSSGQDGYKEVKTATMIGYLESGKVTEVKFVDGDQAIRATLTDDTQVKSKFLLGQGEGLAERAEALVQDKKLKSFDVEVATGNTLANILISIVPFLLFIGIFLFIMTRMQGGGAGVMKFGKS